MKIEMFSAGCPFAEDIGLPVIFGFLCIFGKKYRLGVFSSFGGWSIVCRSLLIAPCWYNESRSLVVLC